MTSAIEARLFRVWLVLSAITLLSWWLGTEHSAASAGVSAAISYGALLIAAIKVRIIVVEYMEAQRASKILQRLMDAWLLLLMVALVGIYALQLGMPPV